MLVITINELGLIAKFHAVPFAAFVKKNVPSPQGLIFQNIESSEIK